MQNVCDINKSIKNNEVRYNIMLNHEVVEHEYESTHSCEHQINNF
jgi:hypothetical protein